jgi:hypothetical protein
MIDHRLIHGAQDSIRNVCRTWNLQKMTACMNHFTLNTKSTLIFYITSGAAVFDAMVGSSEVKAL